MLVGLLTAPDIATELGERAAAEVVARHGEAELGRRLAAAYERLGAVAPVARPPHVESVEEPLDDLLRSWAVSSRRAIDATASWHRAHASLAARGAATAAAGVGHGVVVAPRPVAPRTTLFAVPTWDEPARLRALLRSFSAAFGADAPVSLVLADASGRPLADQVAVLEPILADVGPTADLVLSSAALEPSDSGQGRCVLLAGALDAAPGGLWACEPYVGALEAEHLQTLAGTASRHAGT